MKKKRARIKYIDLFAGAGGMSEGFIKSGFHPVAHVECDAAACYTLKTRIAFHYLKANHLESIYYLYLKGELTRDALYSHIPEQILNSVIQAKIGIENKRVFNSIDSLLGRSRVDLIIGGPPCQAYSHIGRAALKHKTEDERNTLYIHYGRFLKRYKPKVFVFENVPGLLTAADGLYYNNLRKYYRRLGYIVEATLLNARDYDVIQNRERVIIVGWRKNLRFRYPRLRKNVNVNTRDSIFNDLPPILPGERSRITRYSSNTNDYLLRTEMRNGVDFVTQHITRPHNKKDLDIYRLAIENMNKGIRIKNDQIPELMRTQNNTTDFLDRFKVVAELPHAMIAHIAKDGHHFIHPDSAQLRSISVREAARIQSFPDDYYFEGVKEDQPRTAAFRQIGNAVPPVLSKSIAKRIKRLLNG